MILEADIPHVPRTPTPTPPPVHLIPPSLEEEGCEDEGIGGGGGGGVRLVSSYPHQRQKNRKQPLLCTYPIVLNNQQML